MLKLIAVPISKLVADYLLLISAVSMKENRVILNVLMANLVHNMEIEPFDKVLMATKTDMDKYITFTTKT